MLSQANRKHEEKMAEGRYNRRQFIGTAAITVAAAQLGIIPATESRKINPFAIKSQTNTSFGPLR
jgi:hypothetical protein